MELGTATPADALRHLVRRYLRAFGPALAADVASWTGLGITDVRPALDRLELRRFRDADGQTLVDVPRAPLPEASVPAPVRFLPTFDAVLLVHARRTGILPEHFRPLIFNTKMPQSVPTFTVNGRVAGTWRHEGRHVQLEPFEPVPRAARREAEDEAGRLSTFFA